MTTKKNTSKGIVSWPEDERPRERLLSLGPQAMTDAELIAILVRVGLKGISAVELGRQLLNRFGSLRGMVEYLNRRQALLEDALIAQGAVAAVRPSLRRCDCGRGSHVQFRRQRSAGRTGAGSRRAVRFRGQGDRGMLTAKETEP